MKMRMMVLMSVLVLMTGAAGQASWIYTEDFDAVPNGQLPADWTTLAGSHFVQDGVLIDSATTSTSVVANGDAWTDYTIRAQVKQSSWSATTSTWSGIIAYAQSSQEFYGLRFKNSSNSTYPTTVQLIKGLAGGGISSLSTSSNTSYSATSYWTFQLELTTEATQVKVVGKAWRPGQNPDVDSPFRTLTAYDTNEVRYTNGAFGVKDSSGGGTASWDNVMATVPEPMTVGLLALGGVLTFRRRRV